MKVNWDYTDLADAYLKRPEYVSSAIDSMLQKVKLSEPGTICDVGAGTAHLTHMLASKGHTVYAVEPNSKMRAHGMKRTCKLSNVLWFDGVGEETGMETGKFALVTFGSSFNVCDQIAALRESYRILRPNGFFACMWNHRGLDNPLQQEIESIIQKYIINYSYGSRREDQSALIESSGLFKCLDYIEESAIMSIPTEDFIEGWKSHGTLYRQAQDKFQNIIDEIRNSVLKHDENGFVKVPYTTRIWVALRNEVV
ncbi:class I SAM-dependent methyltransferase [Paenibacillus sp. IHBB 10380]|uniref:class I SAM-dependent methyltransferase n=1 Tax=Paenibacillus sp. IHBB 10380 TaxID=1566358 RepID=UPI0005CF9FF3|nr:class I SAM-dependent methyltransferase [Paenibacillus sp. IHBB 10380]AJS61324.1 methyltransferase [Paenibacillus sp. IHBB 10380]